MAATIYRTATIGDPVLSTSQSLSLNLTPTLQGIITPFKYEDTEAHQKGHTQSLTASK